MDIFLLLLFIFILVFSFLFAAVELTGRFVKFVAIFRLSLMGFSMEFDWADFGFKMGAFLVGFSRIS